MQLLGRREEDRAGLDNLREGVGEEEEVGEYDGGGGDAVGGGGEDDIRTTFEFKLEKTK